ncbi:MAG: sigma-70 family RNA polymerase sigma factor [Deltaproteobacteria bacterium]|nr:sigma-70 family RNA polymerase sigma factor [Deltaproteobacteria bacterium]
MSKITENKKAPPADDDVSYVAACQKGDTEAFSVLVQRHSSKMLNIAYRMLGDYDEACDVTQEAFLAAFRAIERFKAEAKFSTWLYRIVVNHTKNRLKQRQSLARHESASLDDPAPECTQCAAGLAGSEGGDPGELLERRELEAEVQKCISALDADYREVLVMRDIQGFAYDEIRDMLQIPDGTVKSRLSRARLAMKDCLRKIIGEL